MTTNQTFDMVELEGVTCGCGTAYEFAPAIDESARHTTAICPSCESDSGIQIDDYRMWCPKCHLRVWQSYAECPNDRSHRLFRLTE